MKILEELQEIFRDVFDDDELVISNETTADDIEDWDSLSHMQLVVQIEKAYNIKFTIAEMKKTANVGEFIEMIEGKLG
ncbi:MAG: acyl carrier protein [Lachnospiraceae bacterium]|nr:acyl carrier protein [Lachnospiraceae bacterium]